MPKAIRTSSSKNKFAAWKVNNAVVALVAGAVITITPTGDFRLMRLAMNFDQNLAVTITIHKVDATNANWNQLIRRIIVPAPGVGLTTDYTFNGGQCYEYVKGDSIQITIAAVAMNVYLSYENEQI